MLNFDIDFKKDGFEVTDGFYVKIVLDKDKNNLKEFFVRAEDSSNLFPVFRGSDSYIIIEIGKVSFFTFYPEKTKHLFLSYNHSKEKEVTFDITFCLNDPDFYEIHLNVKAKRYYGYEEFKFKKIVHKKQFEVKDFYSDLSKVCGIFSLPESDLTKEEFFKGLVYFFFYNNSVLTLDFIFYVEKKMNEMFGCDNWFWGFFKRNGKMVPYLISDFENEKKI